jgi:tRNA(Arg) A34 adenosine deaminase TadA
MNRTQDKTAHAEIMTFRTLAGACRSTRATSSWSRRSSRA